MDAAELKKMIRESLPEGLVIPRHNERGHFYEVPSLGETYPSMTGKLQILKDPSLKNFAVNENNRYIFNHFKEFNDENVMDHLEKASTAAEVKRDTAGDFGTEMHEIRQKYFEDWISEGQKPIKPLMDYIPFEMSSDPRAISCVRALERFLIETLYQPIACELLLYDKRFKVGGTLDDIGLIHKIIRKGSLTCDHDFIFESRRITCYKCGHRMAGRPSLTILDLKTSNQLKDHYWLQVAGYSIMFKTLTRLKPQYLFILKLNKENGTYVLERIRYHSEIQRVVSNFFRLCHGLEKIQELRKDQGKRVGKSLIFSK